MGQRVDDLRAAVGRDVHELRVRLRESYDLRRQVAKHPFIAIAVVVGGVFVSSRIVRLLRGVRTPMAKRTRRERAAASHDAANGPTGGRATRDRH